MSGQQVPDRILGVSLKITASERLETLLQRLDQEPPAPLIAGRELRLALPHIIAVVRAAEQTYMTADIHNALTALEKALRS